MKVHQMHPDPADFQARLHDLERLLAQPTYQEQRPCRGCTVPCPCSASRHCACGCNPSCNHAAMQMSSDGIRYPIEPKIIALVFQFGCLRVCPPYWSCEGHTGVDGNIFRVPQVWFYARSLIYPRLMSELLSRLQFQKKIVHAWHICVSYAGDGLDTGFSIEPDLKTIITPSLPALQQDTLVISAALVAGMRDLAQEYISKYK